MKENLTPSEQTRYPSFEEWLDLYESDIEKGLWVKAENEPVNKSDTYEEFAKLAWHARDAQVKELLEALKAISNYRCEDETTCDTNAMQVIAESAIAKSEQP